MVKSFISFSRCKDTTSQEGRVRERPLTSVNVRERAEKKKKSERHNGQTIVTLRKKTIPLRFFPGWNIYIL
jgi:hypothetical protein